MGIVVKRPVTLKVIVTEAFREALVRQLQAAADEIQIAIQQAEFQNRRYIMDVEKHDIARAMSARRQFEEERAKQEATRQDIIGRIKMAKQLPIGAEFVQGTLESSVELDVGDSLEEKAGRAEVIVRDGIVVEIRDGVSVSGTVSSLGKDVTMGEPVELPGPVLVEPVFRK